MASNISTCDHAPPMRMINTKAHALLDYILGPVLLGSPYLFEFSPLSTAHLICILAGTIIVVLALVTRFEFGLVQAMPVKVHMWCDAAVGCALMFSPVIFHFGHTVFKPHLVFGLTILIVAILTDRVLHSGEKENTRNSNAPIRHDSEKKKYQA